MTPRLDDDTRAGWLLAQDRAARVAHCFSVLVVLVYVCLMNAALRHCASPRG